MSVSALAQTLKGSEIIKIGGEINELKKKGEKIANLTIGDFDPAIFPVPNGLKHGIIDAYHANHTNYPPADGVSSLREEVSVFLEERYKLHYTAKEILIAAGVSEDTKVSDWNDDEISKIREAVSAFTIEGELRSETQLNIKRLMDIGCYRGIRHRTGLPLRGQRTKNNSRTRKGKRKTVANKKKAVK